ncbi:MAG: IS1595 family transposase [Bacteroidetes bacterium]|nr:MAG: IS1595 family transposase [Bacteroidota bacterium]
MTQFKNIQELIVRFSDPKACLEYVEQMRWNGNPVCPHCGQNKPYRLKDGKTFRCKSKTCKKDFTVTTKTIFENSKIALSKWLIALYICTNHKKGISSCQLARDIGTTQKTAWFMLHRLREMVRPKAIPELSEIVEIDTTWVGGKEKNKSKKKRAQLESGERTPKKAPVFGMVERNGNSVLISVPDEQSETLRPLINAVVDKDSIIVSDAATVHYGLENEYKEHVIINHSNDEYAKGIYNTNTIEGAFSQLKRGIYGIYHQVSVKHLQAYCHEFAYRYNTRKIKDSERFELSMRNTEGRIKYKTLIGDKQG